MGTAWSSVNWGKTLWICICLISFLGVQGQENSSKNPPADNAKERMGKDKEEWNLPDHFTYRELDNGLKVLVVQDSAIPMVSVELAVKAGGFVEPPSWNGISNLYNHLVYLGNEDYSDKENLEERAEELGLAFNSVTGLERLSYHVICPDYHLAQGLDYVHSVILKGTFGKEAVETARERAVQKLEDSESPENKLQEDLAEKLWGDDATRIDRLGNKKSIMKLSPKDLKKFTESYYYPNNALLIVAGEVKPADVFRFTREIFTGWKPSEKDVFETHPVPGYKKLHHSLGYITVDEIARVPMVMVGYHGPELSKDPSAAYAAKVLATYLNFEGSAFQKELLNNDLAVSAGAEFNLKKHYSAFRIDMIPKPKVVVEAVNKLKKEIRKWEKEDYYSGSLLDQAKKQLVLQEVYHREGLTGLTHRISYWWGKGGLNNFAAYKEKINGVSPEDITGFVKQYIIDQPRAIGGLSSLRIRTSTEMEKVVRKTEKIQKYATLFGVGSSEITDSSDIEELKDVEYLLNINPDASLIIHGYSSWTGPSWLNEELSRKRAEAAKRMIVEWGNVTPDRIKTIGHGEHEQTNDPEQLKKDRSARFEVKFPKEVMEKIKKSTNP